MVVCRRTMLMTTAYLEETVRDCVRPAVLPIGIHLSLTLGKAVASAAQVPDLVDEAGQAVAEALLAHRGDVTPSG